MPQRSVVAVGASLLVASLALAGCGTRGESDSDATGGGDCQQGRQDRRHRAPVRRPRRPRQGHQELGRPGHQAGQRVQGHPGLDPRARGRGRRGQARRRQERRDQARVRQGRRRCRRHAELQRRAERPAGARVGEDHHGLPGEHNPSLTQGADFATAPARTYPNYFRTCTTDSIQGPFAARYLFEKAGIKEVATVNDKKTYGQGLVNAFTEEYTKLGGKIVAAETINPDDDKYDAVISKIKPSNPKAVYYGGEYPQAGPFSQQMKAAGLNVPLMGGDGIYSGEYIKLAGATAEGDLATSVGAPTDTLPSAKAFVDAYNAGGYAEPVRGLRRLLVRRGQRHHQRAEGLARQRRLGRGGPPGHHRRDGQGLLRRRHRQGAFDEYGDTTSKVLTTYGVKGGKWEAVSTEEFK